MTGREVRRNRPVAMLDAEWNDAALLGVLMGNEERGRPFSAAEAIRGAVRDAIAAYGRQNEQKERNEVRKAPPPHRCSPAQAPAAGRAQGDAQGREGVADEQEARTDASMDSAERLADGRLHATTNQPPTANLPDERTTQAEVVQDGEQTLKHVGLAADRVPIAARPFSGPITKESQTKRRKP